MAPLPNLSSTSLSCSPVSPTCGFEGNPDIYGVGVRLGAYMLALAAWFANYFVASEARILRPANLLYVLALQMCMGFYTANPREVYAVEVFIILTFLLCIGFIATSTTQTRYSARLLPTTRLYLVTHKGLTVFTLWFGFWFWFVGCCGYKETGCGVYVWLLGKANLHDYSVFNKMTVMLYFPISVWYPTELIATLMLTLAFLKSRVTRATFAREIHFESVKDKISRVPEAFLSFATGDLREVLGTFTRTSPRDGLLGRSAQAFEKTREAEDFIDKILLPYIDPRSQNLALLVETNTVSWRDPRAIMRKLSSHFGWLELKIALACRPADLPITEAWPIAYSIIEHARLLRIDEKYMQDVVNAAFQAWTSYPRDFCNWIESASKVRNYQLRNQSQPGWCIQAVLGFFLWVFLVVEIEMTLRWNNVSGINDFHLFGQLMALFVGFFGLMSVVYQKIVDKTAGIEERGKRLERSPYDNAIDDYLVWKSCTHTCSSTV